MNVKFGIAVLGLMVATLVLPLHTVSSQETGTMSLRGNVALDENNTAPMVAKQDTKGQFKRAYRQQPPLIPHKIRGYEIDLKINQCMGCHDWPSNVDFGAPKISETHYINRDGVAVDYVARTRWFCTQCHVPQASAKALVGNNFKSALEVNKN